MVITAEIVETVSTEVQTLLPKLISQRTIVITNKQYQTEICLLLTAWSQKKHPRKPVLVIVRGDKTRRIEREFQKHRIRYQNVQGSKRSKRSYMSYNVVFVTSKILHKDLKDQIITPDIFAIVLLLEAENGLESSSAHYLSEHLTPHSLVAFTRNTGFKTLAKIGTRWKTSKCEVVHSIYDRGEHLTGLSDSHFVKVGVVIGEVYYQIRKEIIMFINKMCQPLIKRGFIKESLVSQKNIGHLHTDLVKRKERHLTVHTAYILYSYHLLQVVMTQGLESAHEWLLERIEKYSKDVTEAWHFFLKREDVKKIIQSIAANQIPHPRLEKVALYVRQHQGRKVIVCPDKELRKAFHQRLHGAVHVILAPESISTISGKRLRRMYAEFSNVSNTVFIVSSLNDQVARRADIVILPEIKKRVIQNVLKYSDYDYRKVVFLTKESKEERIFNSTIKRKTKINLTEINKHLEEQTRRRKGQLKRERVRIKYDPRIIAKGIPLDLRRLEDKGIELVEGRLKMIGLFVEKYNHFIFFLYPEFLRKFIENDVLGDFCGIISKNYADTTIVMPPLHVYDELMLDTKKQIDDQLFKYGFKCYKGYPLNYLIPRIVKDLGEEVRLDQGMHKPLLELLVVAINNIQRAKSVLNTFSTLDSLRTATVEQLCEVNGVNVTTARIIKEYFN